MSVLNPGYQITRWSVVGMEGMYAKMFDPPTASPPTPDAIAATNPVPEVMAAAGYLTDALNQPMQPSTPHTVQRALMSDLVVPTWDGRKTLNFFTISDPDINSTTLFGTYPGPTTRVPRGVLFHCETRGKGPPPHTIHWHGIEPTPMNDGVGHCSMEVGGYTYQWQPNFIGTYFYHCHRNTVQHFEFGLFGLLPIEPPDAYFASIASTNPDGSVVLNQIPIGHCRDGKRRTAANLTGFPQFPNFNGNLLTAPDPWTGDARLKFATDPHAMTVAYDVEAIWVLDDRDSTWSDLAPNARTTYPTHGDHPGINDQFTNTPGANGFFAFNDFNADYWFVTGVPVPASKGGVGAIPAGIVIPPELNSGVTGSQVSISAKVGQTILIRALDAAYNSLKYRFPVDVVIIAWDGRALGVPPYGYNQAYLVPAGTPIKVSTARRFDALIRTTPAMLGTQFAEVDFINTRGELPGQAEEVLCTARIPIVVAPGVPDGTVPTGTITINGGATVTKSRSVTLTLTASSTAGAISQMQFSKDGGAFFPFEPFAPSRTVTLTAGDGAKTIAVRFKDDIGNLSQPISAGITLDTAAPAAGTVVINGGAQATSSRVVTLALTAPPEVTQMQFSKDGVSYFAWEAFAASRTATLTAGDGLKTIWVRFRDAAGNVSAPASDSITLATALPTGTIAFTTTDPTTSATGVVALTASAGVTQMQFSKNGSGFFAWEPFAATRTIRLSLGVNTVAVRFRDAAGNVSLPVSDSITRN